MAERGKVLVFALALFGAISAGANCQAPKRADQSEQSVFGLELPFVRPVAVPDGVIQALKSDFAVTTNICEQQNPSDATLHSWLVASEIHLAEGSGPDLLVMAKHCLSGANEVHSGFSNQHQTKVTI